MSHRAWLLLVLGMVACRDRAAPTIAISLGATPSDEASFVPRSSLAEYIEVSATQTKLLVSMSDQERTCEATAEPSKDALGLSLQLVLPEGAKLGPGSYPLQKPDETAPVGYASATVKMRGQRRELLPGGSVELSAVDLSPQGSVEGLLKLEFPGDAEHPRTRVSGRFVAYFCRINRLR